MKSALDTWLETPSRFLCHCGAALRLYSSPGEREVVIVGKCPEHGPVWTRQFSTRPPHRHRFSRPVYESSVVTGAPLCVRYDCVCGARGNATDAGLQQLLYRASTPPEKKWEPWGHNGLIAGWRLR